MKVELLISNEIKNPTALIKSDKLTDNIKKAIKILENEDKNLFIQVKKDGKMSFLDFEEIYLIKVEDKKVQVYSENQKYTTNKRLYELETLLNTSFIRISKSSIVNIRKIDYVAPSLKGIMFIQLKNGLKDNISRNYLANFKTRLKIK